MPKLKLDHQTIHGLNKPETPTAFYDTVESGLTLRLSKAGSKTFAYRYRFNGKNKRYTIGKFPAISLSEARKKVQKLKVQVNEGIDPNAEKHRKRYECNSTTFEDVVRDYKMRHLPTLREKTRNEYERIIDKELLPKLGQFELTKIYKNQIMELLDEIAYGKNPHPTMANRVRARLSGIFSFAQERGLIEVNTVDLVPKYKSGERRRERFYSDEEIIELWTFFEDWNEPIQSALKMLLICGQRKSETLSMRFDEIRDGIWTIPGSKTKNGYANVVPLPNLALEIISEMKDNSNGNIYVFESPKDHQQPISWLGRATKHIKVQSSVKDFRMHDLRRTVATNLAKLGVSREIAERLRNHRKASGEAGLEGIYNRYDYMKEKREAMNTWNLRLNKIISGELEAIITKIA